MFEIPEIMGASNPVPGYESNTINRNLPPHTADNNPQLQNVTDPSRIVRADGKTEQQDNGALDHSGLIRYDSNFQTFLERLQRAPGLAEVLSNLFAQRESIEVLSGVNEGLAAELSQALTMLKMDEKELLQFLSDQFKSGSRFGGTLFALLRSAYARAASDATRTDILEFSKAYLDFSSTEHLEGNILRNLQEMADAMPESWAEKLRELSAQAKELMNAGDRKGCLSLLQQEVFPLMSAYVRQTHDLGLARQLLSLLTLDMSRYENGSEENLLQMYHRMTSYGTLKEQLGGIDDATLLKLLQTNAFSKTSAAGRFAEHLSSAALHALHGGGNAATQEIFQQLVGAILVNESVYMPVNHFILPLEWNGKFLFSEMWVDPDAENGADAKKRSGRTVKILFKMDIQSLGAFDMLLTSSAGDVDLQISCPEKIAPFSAQMETALSHILVDNGLTPVAVKIRKMERPVALTEVFPQIFERKNGVNVKV